MTQTINIRIESDKTSVENSQLLDALRLELERETEIECTKETVPAPKDMQGIDPTVAIELANIGLQLLNAVMPLIVIYWTRKQKPITLTVQGENYSWTKEMTKAESDEAIAKITSSTQKNITFKIEE